MTCFENIIPMPLNIVLHLQGGWLQQISYIHPFYTPLHYVLLFPSSKEGWHPNIEI